LHAGEGVYGRTQSNIIVSHTQARWSRHVNGRFVNQGSAKAGNISHDDLSRLFTPCLMLAIMIAAKVVEYYSRFGLA
jgi:hypothetical protein